MGILDNVFVKKALKSMLTEEQFKTMQTFTTAVQSGKIDQGKLSKVGNKISKMSPEEVNSLLDMIDKTF
jgi:hypothetical protein